MTSLNGKIAIVTGAARGIGFGIAHRLAEEGAAVGLMDRNKDGLEKAKQAIEKLGQKALVLPCDVANAESVRQAAARLIAGLGQPHVIVHAAGVMPTGTLDETLEEDWDRVFAVNVKGAYLLLRELIPPMRVGDGGSVILVASLTGSHGYPSLAAYSSTKGALTALARAMAIDYARDGIRVNSVSPGTIDTPMLEEFVAQQPDPLRTRKAFDDVQPRGRVGTVEEVANVVAFLASENASLINGSDIRVDGAAGIKGDQPRC